jgi:flagellar biosynthesis protein FlhF
MRVKLYRAEGMQAAMAQMRAELGADALILTSRRVAGGVELTAALDAPEEMPAPVSEQVSPAVVPDAARHAMLVHHRMPASVARKLQAGALAFAVSTVFRFARLDLGARSRPLMLVGPPGGGKTLTAARLATRLVLAGVTPLVITADGRRAGAVEQLAAFTRLLGLGLVAASQPASLRQALSGRMADAPVVIDAPGLDLFDRAQRAEMMDLAATTNAVMALVLPAGLDPAESADLATAGMQAGATLLIATRLDLVRRLGGVLAAAEAGLAMAEAGVGPGAADGLVPLTPEFLAARLNRYATSLEKAA